MPTMIAIPITNRTPLVTNLVRVDWTEAASAKMTAKKKTTATAMAPNTVIIFTFMFGVASSNLILPLNGQKCFFFRYWLYPENSFISRLDTLRIDTNNLSNADNTRTFFWNFTGHILKVHLLSARTIMSEYDLQTFFYLILVRWKMRFYVALRFFFI